MKYIDTSKFTLDDIKEFVDEIVEEKLINILKDPDEGLELREDIKVRLKKSLKSQADGEKGILMENIKRHGLNILWPTK